MLGVNLEIFINAYKFLLNEAALFFINFRSSGGKLSKFIKPGFKLIKTVPATLLRLDLQRLGNLRGID